MSTTKTYSDKDIKKILRKNGFVCERQTGSHQIYTNEVGIHITIRCTKCNKMIWQSMIKKYNLVV